jgi:hypothetical protein
METLGDEASNTMVIFTSDHGEMLGAHGKRGKNDFYEGNVINLTFSCQGVLSHHVGFVCTGGAIFVLPLFLAESSRVPFLISWRGMILPHTKVEEKVSHLDVSLLDHSRGESESFGCDFVGSCVIDVASCRSSL